MPLELPRAAGLSSSQAAALLLRDGPNRLPPAPAVHLWRRVLAALRDPLVVVLGGALALTLATRDLADSAVITVVLLVNTTVAVRQQVGADRALTALGALAAPSCQVVRDAVEHEVPAADLVVGDLVLLGEGDLVPADGVLVDGSALRVDEATLTGESVAVDKTPTSATGTDVEPANRVLSGTAVVHGRGTVRVVATGPASALGQVAALLHGPRTVTPLERRMARLSTLIAVGVLAVCLVVLAIGWWRGEPLALMLVTAASLAVAAVPESLPVVVTVTLALAARRMAHRHALVRDLAAAETLGSVTLLATDKTGTLTRAQMSVVEWWAPEGVDPADLARAAALCNDARLGAGPDGAPVGDPTEVALLVASEQTAADDVRARHPRIGEIPFDSVRQQMWTLHRTPAGALLTVTKGAPERVLDPGRLAEPAERVAVARAAAHRMSQQGLRVIAFAERSAPASDAIPAPAQDELRLLGFVGLHDPLRADARATVAACRRAGIRLVLLTGDHVSTATAVATEVGLAVGPVRSLDLATAGDGSAGGGDPAALAPDRFDVDVVARARPQDKVAAVQAWQTQGHVVAMVGDGVNDGPALRRAAIGVAMGRRGSEVARQAADLVLADDDLGTVVVAVEEGRRVYANIRRFLLYGLAGGVAELIVMLVGPLAGVPLPLRPGQILWVNLLTHSLAGTALGAEPADSGLMTRPPRPPDEGVLGGGLWWRIGVMAVLVAGCAATTAALVPPGVRQSALVVGLSAAVLGVAVGVRARVTGRGPAAGVRDNPAFPASVLAAAALLVAAVEWSPLQAALTTTSPGPLGYGVALAGAALCGSVARALRVQ